MHTLPIKYPSDDIFGRRQVLLVLFLTCCLLALAAFYALLRPGSPGREISQAQMFAWIKEGGVTQLVNEPNASTGIRYLAGVYKEPGANDAINFEVPVDLALDPYLFSELRQAGYKGTIETENNTHILVPLFLNFVPLVLFLILVILAVRAVGRWLYQALNR